MITERLLQARYDNLKKTHLFYTFYCSGVYETFEYIELKMHFAAKEENRRRYDYTVG